MKRILCKALFLSMTLIFLFSKKGYCQTYSGVLDRNAKEKWMGHIKDSFDIGPRYRGRPSGLRTGTPNIDGPYAFDTLNGDPYYRWNGLWMKGKINRSYKDTGYLWMNNLTTYYCYGASHALVSGTPYPNRVRDSTGTTLTNRAQAGTGLYGAIRKIWTDDWLSSTRTGLVSVQNLEIEAFVFNKNDPKLEYTKVRTMTNIAVGNLLLKSYKLMSDASVTKSGFSNATVNFATKSTTMSSSVQYSVVDASTLSFSLTTTEAGQRLIFGIPTSEKGKPLGQVKVEIDGLTTYTTYNANQAYAKDSTFTALDESGIEVYPGGFIYGGGNTGSTGGLSVGSHSIVITAITTGDTVFVDYAGVIDAPSKNKPIVFLLGVHMDVDNGMGSGLDMRPYHNMFQDYVNTAASDAIADTYGDQPISVVDVNQYVAYGMGMKGFTDPIHYNDFGSSDVARAVMDGIRWKRIDRGGGYGLPVDPNSSVTTIGVGQVGYGGGTGAITSEAAFAYDASTDRVSVGKITVTAGTITAGTAALSGSATMPATFSTPQYGVVWNISGNGSVNAQSYGMGINFGSGYTGIAMNAAITGFNNNNGTGSVLIPAAGSNAVTGTWGVTGGSGNTSAGLRGGILGVSWDGTAGNVGVMGLVQQVTNNAPSYGVIGSAVNTGTSAIEIGGWFHLNQTTLPSSSVALRADNGTQSAPIAEFADNNTTKVTIADGGDIIPASGVNIGAQATPFKNLWLYGGGTFGTHSIKLDGTPTGHRVWTFPDATSTIVGTDVTQTLSNKRWVPRVGSTTSSATPTINTDNVDIYKLTAQAAAITSFTTNLSGTPNDGDILEIQITDDGTARAITWGASFVSSTVTLPTTTVISTTLSVVFQYYVTSSYGNNKWVCVNYF